MMGIRSLGIVGVLFIFLVQGCREHNDSLSETRIIGGRKADYHSFMVAVRDAKGDSQFCGGSWIDEGVILTAAHCLYGETSKLTVTVGATDKDDVTQANTFKVRSAVLHPDFVPDRDMKNDVALLFVDAVDHSRLPRAIAPIKLNADRAFPKAGDMVSPVGWGNETSFGTIFGSDLRQVDVPVVSHATCRQGGKYYDSIDDDFEICAGHVDKGGFDSCQGDSGGPLIATVDGQPVLVGIVSWGIECAQKSRPGVYTRVSKHVSWIKQEIDAYKRPVTLDAASLVKAVASACYANFSGTEMRAGLPYTFGYQVGSLEKAESAPAHGRSLHTCSFNRAGLGLVNVFVAPVNGKPHFFVAVAGESWHGPAKSQFEVETECSEGEDDFYVVKTFNSLMLIYKQKKFVSTALVAPAVGAPVAQATCKERHVDLSYQVFGTGSAEKQYVTVSFPEAGAEPLTYLLQEDNDLPASAAGLQLLHDFADPTNVQVEFRHRGNVDIYTWELDCPFKYQLVAEDGTVFKADDGRPNHYAVAFSHGTHSQAAIERGKGVKFSMVFNSPATPEKLAMCSVNGVPLDVD